ncbi:hypothetical protein QTP88_017561 [Uroleucon formosanum]
MLRQQKKKILINLLLEEIEKEEIIIEEVMTKSVNDLYLTRKEEGFFSVLIEKHLFRDEKKLREFFRLRWEQFNYVLNLIEDDLKLNPYNRVKEPISPAEKFAVTLRVFYTQIPIKPGTVDHLILSACCLHNLLQYTLENTSEQLYYNFDPNDYPANNMVQLEHTRGYGNYEGFLVRDEFKKIFNSPQGTVPWQNYHTLRTDTS